MQRKHAANLVNCAYLAFLAAGIVLPLLKSSKREKERGWRSLEAVGGSLLVGQALKHTIPEERPDGKDKTSFPSGHTAYSFAIATIASAFARKQALFWYSAAFLIGLVRVRLRRHHWWDVLSGALLGMGMAYGQLASKAGWLLPILARLPGKNRAL